MNLIDFLQPQANTAAIDAANAAVNDLSARPFNVVLSVSADTQAFIAFMMIGGVVAAHIFKRRS
ncbi:MAG: hypothetical protein Q7U78_06300 [Gallionella sp.]|nr:hypothetical protein [Gallionella sp.]